MHLPTHHTDPHFLPTEPAEISSRPISDSKEDPPINLSGNINLILDPPLTNNIAVIYILCIA